ncbi:MAG: hypothetical protein HOP29_11020 [Phycisphaerales bacterium]|nr:hypothetical protein [Phycisphaerales bacterium]
MLCVVGALACFGLTNGCGPDLLYLPSLIAGQLQAIAGSVPVEKALEGGNLDADQQAKLRLIQDARIYAIETMGLRNSRSFTLFLDLGDSTRVYNVSASEPDSLSEQTWSFPFVGTVPYLGFFDRELAERFRDRLTGEGLDVLMYEVDAYSLRDLLPNPIRSGMLRRDDLTVIETVIHELLHDTVFRSGDTDFNESLATFVARAGTVEYLRDRAFDENIIADAAERFDDTDAYNAFMFRLFADLQDYYATDIGREAKIAGREAVFQAGRDRFLHDVHPTLHHPESYEWVQRMPTNNAWMLANYRYNLDLGLFGEVYAATGFNWANTLDVFRSAAAAPEPKAFLSDWLAARVD